MTTKTKTRLGTWSLALALGLALSGAREAGATANPANDSAGFTIRITPNVDRGVEVDTTGSAWSDGIGAIEALVTMDLGTTYLLSQAVKVTILGNFNNQELDVQGAQNNDWALASSGTQAEDALRLYALFGKDGGSSFAAADFLDDTHLITTAVKRAGENPNTSFEADAGHAEYMPMTALTVGTSRLLWLRADTPTTTLFSGEQSFTVTLTSQFGS